MIQIMVQDHELMQQYIKQYLMQEMYMSMFCGFYIISSLDSEHMLHNLERHAWI